MLRHKNKLFNPTRLGRVSWVALLALAWMQVAIASHQSEHALGSLAESCHVCVQLERLDDGLTIQSAPIVETNVRFAESHRYVPRITHRPAIRGFDSRAPPTL